MFFILTELQIRTKSVSFPVFLNMTSVFRSQHHASLLAGRQQFFENSKHIEEQNKNARPPKFGKLPMVPLSTEERRSF